MKLRYGFVSNSSSSSFCIYGTCYTFDEILDKIRKVFNEEEIKKFNLDSEYKDESEAVFYLGKKVGLHVEIDGECDECYIGRTWKSIKDDETGKEFKEDVENKIKQFDQEAKCETYDTEIYC